MEIGRSGDLCWYISEDLRRFKRLTMGHAVVMGRKTWESLPNKPLPGRLNIIVSASASPDSADNTVWATSLEEAIEKAGERDVFIIGGESVYRQAFGKADRLEITRILSSAPDADRFFPEISEKEWILTDESDTFTSGDGLDYRYETYSRK